MNPTWESLGHCVRAKSTRCIFRHALGLPNRPSGRLTATSRPPPACRVGRVRRTSEIGMAAGLGRRADDFERVDRLAGLRRGDGDERQARRPRRSRADPLEVIFEISLLIVLSSAMTPPVLAFRRVASCGFFTHLPCFLTCAFLHPLELVVLPTEPSRVAICGAGAALVPGPWHSSEAWQGGGHDVGEEAAVVAGVVDLHRGAVVVLRGRAPGG